MYSLYAKDLYDDVSIHRLSQTITFILKILCALPTHSLAGSP